VLALRQQWTQMLMQAVRVHGLTLLQSQTVKELRLSWKEMKALDRFLKRTLPQAWGQEYRLSGQTIQQWQQTGHITLCQATWLAQRGQRQLTAQIPLTQPRLWASTARVVQARPWHIATTYQARKTPHQTAATIQAFHRQRQQLGRVYRTWLALALREERQRYKVHQQARAAHRGRQQSRRLAHGQDLAVQIASLDDALERCLARQRQQAQGWER
jgi:hypothetical protein